MGIESTRRELAPSNLRTAKIRSENFRTDRRRKFFRVVAKHAYPRKTAQEVRLLTKQQYGERTVYDWLDGRSDAPMAVFVRLMGEILDE